MPPIRRIVYACFHRRRPLLVEHVVFAMHCYSFALLTLLLAMLAFRLNVGRLSMTVMLAVLPVVIIWQVVHIARAIRRFYFSAPRSRVAAWTVSALAAPVVYLLNSVFITVLQFAGAAFAITRL